MARIKWVDGHIEVEPPKKPKKITGTYFATVLGFDPWKTPFEAWCKNTRTYEEPFAGNKYTNAGEIIEPKVFDFLRNSMGFGDKVVTPTDVYGEDYFKKTHGDFFPEYGRFGGMWDALIVDDERKPKFVVEVKTVQVDGRSGSLDERWRDGEAPHYQALQASLYAWMLGIDDVLMVAVALEDKKGDYEHPEQVVPSYTNHNVYIDAFKVSERYPNFELYFEKAIMFWDSYVATGISPDYDEKKDAAILKALRTNSVESNIDLNTLIAEAEELKAEIEKTTRKTAEANKRLEKITEDIKKSLLEQFREGDTAVTVQGSRYIWSFAKSESGEIDKEALAADGLLEKYTKPKTNYRLTTREIKEEK